MVVRAEPIELRRSPEVHTSPSRLAYCRKLIALARAEAVSAAIMDSEQVSNNPMTPQFAYTRKLKALGCSNVEESATAADDRQSCCVEDTIEIAVPTSSSSSASSSSSSSHKISRTNNNFLGPLSIQHSIRVPPKPLTCKSMGYEVGYQEFKVVQTKMRLVDLDDDLPDDDDDEVEDHNIINNDNNDKSTIPGVFSCDDDEETMATSSTSDDNSTLHRANTSSSLLLQRHHSTTTTTFQLKNCIDDELEDILDDIKGGVQDVVKIFSVKS